MPGLTLAWSLAGGEKSGVLFKDLAPELTEFRMWGESTRKRVEEALLEIKEVVSYWTFVFFTFPTPVTSSDKMQLREGRI